MTKHPHLTPPDNKSPRLLLPEVSVRFDAFFDCKMSQKSWDLDNSMYICGRIAIMTSNH